MLKFITEEPAADASKDRGHSVPFFSDMVFSYNKAVINAKFFRSGAQERDASTQKSLDKLASP